MVVVNATIADYLENVLPAKVVKEIRRQLDKEKPSGDVLE
jgi:hypothetical protein